MSSPRARAEKPAKEKPDKAKKESYVAGARTAESEVPAAVPGEVVAPGPGSSVGSASSAGPQQRAPKALSADARQLLEYLDETIKACPEPYLAQVNQALRVLRASPDSRPANQAPTSLLGATSDLLDTDREHLLELRRRLGHVCTCIDNVLDPTQLESLEADTESVDEAMYSASSGGNGNKPHMVWSEVTGGTQNIGESDSEERESTSENDSGDDRVTATYAELARLLSRRGNHKGAKKIRDAGADWESERKQAAVKSSRVQQEYSQVADRSQLAELAQPQSDWTANTFAGIDVASVQAALDG